MSAAESESDPSAKKKVVLSLCMIVRDAERTLPACLTSIKPWVDEMVVVDTGSHDKTVDIAKSFGANDWFMLAVGPVWIGQQYIAWMWTILGGGL